ncbi:hypothetical protein GEMRC1_008034 [Eukaryota sp. GEM-RC1]
MITSCLTYSLIITVFAPLVWSTALWSPSKTNIMSQLTTSSLSSMFPYHNDITKYIHSCTPSNVHLPTSYDIRSQGCGNYIVNQGVCGSCYAWTAATTLTDMYCFSNQSVPFLSPQTILSCGYTLGCGGGIPYFVFITLESKGIPTLDCVSYKSGGGRLIKCPKKCDVGGEMKMYKAKANSTCIYTGEEDMKRALVIHGVLQVTFVVYRDFMDYGTGIYHRTRGIPVGLHSVRLIGYGEEDGIPYWTCANSWGNDWGNEDGFFRILRGVDECKIESLGAVGAFAT